MSSPDRPYFFFLIRKSKQKESRPVMKFAKLYNHFAKKFETHPPSSGSNNKFFGRFMILKFLTQFHQGPPTIYGRGTLSPIFRIGKKIKTKLNIYKRLK